jgi:hypothetical protein
MKLSVKRMWGAVQVRGGRVLVVTHDHQISTTGYDARCDDPKNEDEIRRDTGAQPFQPRTFDAKWTNARVGDLAVEIVGVKVDRVLGYTYVSGDSINVIRYVSDADRDLVAGWFSTGKGIRFTPVPSHRDGCDNGPTMEQFICSMMAIKYGGADIAVATITTQNEAEQDAASRSMLEVFRYEDETRLATTDVLLKVTSPGVFRRHPFALLHMQAEGRVQKYACQPFVFDILESSPELVHHEFLVSMAPTGPPTPL